MTACISRYFPDIPPSCSCLSGQWHFPADLAPDSIDGAWNLRAAVERIRKESPDTKLYYKATLPFSSFGRYKKRGRRERMYGSQSLSTWRRFAKEGIAYINLFTILQRTMYYLVKLTGDGLHLNEMNTNLVKAIRRRYKYYPSLYRKSITKIG